MVQRRSKNKKQENTKTQQINGFEMLLSTHTEALESNSMMIAAMLQELVDKSKTKPLSQNDRKTLKSINRTLKNINKDLESLGE